ncbi:MAG: hypothetical protein AAFR83_03165 [Cyanobacteria bacterium J06629_18]
MSRRHLLHQIPADNKLAAGVRAFKFRELDRHSLELIWFLQGKGKAKWQQKSNDLFWVLTIAQLVLRIQKKV